MVAPESILRSLPGTTTSRTPSCPHLKPLWKHSYVPFADFVRVSRRSNHVRRRAVTA